MTGQPVRPEWIYGTPKPERPAWVDAPGCCEHWTAADGCTDGHAGRQAMSQGAREFKFETEGPQS
jgi:hypothetical protein